MIIFKAIYTYVEDGEPSYGVDHGIADSEEQVYDEYRSRVGLQLSSVSVATKDPEDLREE